MLQLASPVFSKELQAIVKSKVNKTVMKLKIVRTIESLRAQTPLWHAAGQTCAIVPTMGALHEGHMQLVRRAFQHADHVVVSIFVNPKQFGVTEDLSRYPRDEDNDVALLANENVDLVFAPNPAEMYPPDFATSVHVSGPAKAGLEDKFRPHFFDGVATIVSKLFIQSAADCALFGEKDYQQLQVIKRMAQDLDLPIKIIGVETERVQSGLALSSRNRYLTKADFHGYLLASHKLRCLTPPRRSRKRFPPSPTAGRSASALPRRCSMSSCVGRPRPPRSRRSSSGCA